MTHFNDRIKKLRKQKDMTQEQLAEYIGVSTQAISRWETGATCPDISALPQLAELFNITIDELLGVNEKVKRQEINAVIADAEEKINNTGETEGPIIKLKEALNKYPNNERLLCSLMYALYVASEDEDLCKEYDAEIVSIAYRIQQHSTDDDSRNEARRILFRHYCDTNRKAEAIQIADGMARIETCLERNIYWALEDKDRLDYLEERITDDLHYLLWDIHAYSTYADLKENDKVRFDDLRANIEKAVRKLFPVDLI